MREITRNATACYCINLRRSNTALTNFYDNELKESGLSVSQYSILNNIRKLKSCNVSELANFIGLERTTLIRGLKPLFDKGYIVENLKNNSTKKQIELTKEGYQIVEQAACLWKKAQEKVEEVLNEEERNELIRLLNKIEKI